jgi:hypothetical protein
MLKQIDRALWLAQRVTSGDGAWPPTLKAPPMPALPSTDEILDTISEAAVEIANLSGPDNVVCRRLRSLAKKLTAQSVSVGELAERIDMSPRDVLDAAIVAGVRPFWHEGQQFRDPGYLRSYLRLQFHYDPVRELEFNLTPDVATRLAEELSVTTDELLTNPEGDSGQSNMGPRKFVASESRLPGQANMRREQMG